MSPRRRTRKDTAGYPTLSQFARAYLHEDFVHEYGGAVDAARAFGADANAKERRALSAELVRLADEAADWPAAKLQAFVSGTIGAAWASASVSVLREMAAVLNDAS